MLDFAIDMFIIYLFIHCVVRVLIDWWMITWFVAEKIGDTILRVWRSLRATNVR